MRAAFGIFLLVGAVYVLAGPGRIDIIDGQYRFEVAKNILEDGSIQIMDPVLGWAVQGIKGIYSPYNVSGSLAGVPLVALADLTGSASRDRRQFFFSFTSAVLGAATAAVLFLFYEALGVRRRTAVGWTMVASFATLAFPAATTVFDQAQHGFFMLCACFLAFLSARRDSITLAGLGGVCLAILVNYQEIYAVLFPGLAVAALAAPDATPTDRRRGLERAAVFVFVGFLGLLVWAGINNYRYGSLVFSGKGGATHPPALGNPVIGLAGLLFSPGKSILLYSPATMIALVGLPGLTSRHSRLGRAVLITSIIYLGVISCLSFYGGDWCWGPRYFASVLPLLALGFPFVEPVTGAARGVVASIIAASVGIQVLGVSVDHHRFFYARSLPTYFWYTEPSFYFTHSALLSRPTEVLDSIEHGVPTDATEFRPGPYSALLTYAVFGGWGQGRTPTPVWMRRYQVFWLPRPWPLWMRSIPAERRPINAPMTETLFVIMGLAGALLLREQVRVRVMENRE